MDDIEIFQNGINQDSYDPTKLNSNANSNSEDRHITEQVPPNKPNLKFGFNKKTFKPGFYKRSDIEEDLQKKYVLSQKG